MSDQPKRKPVGRPRRPTFEEPEAPCPACPGCGNPARRYWRKIPDRPVLGCVACDLAAAETGVFTLEWLPDSPGRVDALRRTFDEADRRKAFLEADESHPMFTAPTYGY